MADKRDTSSEHLTFSQRYGYEPLPEPMRLEHISDDLRREIWNALREFLDHDADIYSFSSTTRKFIERVLGTFLKKSEDEIRTEYDTAMTIFRNHLFQVKFNKFLDFVEIMINDEAISKDFVNRIAKSCEGCAAAYWVDMSSRPFQFYPRTSREQGEATQQAIETLRESGMEGATTHLRQAAEHINTQQYADSIADSIHAVESVARKIDSKAGKTLTPALDSLEKAGLLNHPALKQGFEKLYGYASDEQGIRHALLEKGTPDVDVDEAMFMFGACASFAAYLVNRHRQMNQEQDGGQ